MRLAGVFDGWCAPRRTPDGEALANHLWWAQGTQLENCATAKHLLHQEDGPWTDDAVPSVMRGSVFSKFMVFAHFPELLRDLAVGRAQQCVFDLEEIAKLKQGFLDGLLGPGFELHRTAADRTDVLLDFRFLTVLLKNQPKIQTSSWVKAFFNSKIRWTVCTHAALGGVADSRELGQARP